MLNNLFTYPTLDGKRKLRTYVKVAIVLLIILAFIFAYGLWTGASAMAAIQATAVPVQAPANLVIPATETPVDVTSTPPGVTCPADPATWQFLDVNSGDNLKKIAPTCVYDGLGKTVAWAMMVYQGYTIQEMNQTLGFATAPVGDLGTVNVMTNFKGPISVTVDARPSNANYSQWFIDTNGKQATVYSLRGCFRTTNIIGGNVQSWGNGYAVICQVGEDSINAYTFMALDGEYYTSGKLYNGRGFSLFGYDGKEWVWLGEEAGMFVATKPGTVLQEIQQYSTPYGAPIWNAKWLSDTFGVTTKALPANWATYTDTKALNSILGKLNQGGTP